MNRPEPTDRPEPVNRLDVANLRIAVGPEHAPLHPVTDVSFSVPTGGALAVIGESGSGKTLTLRALMDMLPRGARRDGGSIRYVAADGSSTTSPADARGRGMAMVFQDASAALNPTRRVGDQIAEGVLLRGGISKRAARAEAIALMHEVGIRDPEVAARGWPHQFSGGMRQRVMIAMALSTRPDLLLCDEPTSALDVTVQEQIVRLLADLRVSRDLSIVFVTHDLAVVGQLCDTVAVMYAGQVVELGSVAEVFAAPTHPYTRALVDAIPRPGEHGELATIPGQPPSPEQFTRGCRFAPRCARATAACVDYRYAAPTVDSPAACLRPLPREAT
jgi:oligopeptide/dipeptide ABC transporter ATP-binding protein